MLIILCLPAFLAILGYGIDGADGASLGTSFGVGAAAGLILAGIPL